MRIRMLLAAGIAAAALAGCSMLLGAARSEPAVVQPVSFNHEAHVKGEEMDCADCHEGDKEAVAGFGDIRSCHQCHEDALGDADTELQKQVREYGKARREIPWVQVTRNAGHVYFSHRAHVAFAGMKCEECHGDVGSLTSPPETPDRSLLRMDTCMDCHLERGATLQCIACHQ